MLAPLCGFGRPPTILEPLAKNAPIDCKIVRRWPRPKQKFASYRTANARPICQDEFCLELTTGRCAQASQIGWKEQCPAEQ
jgi:hypothetical protein